MGFKVLFVNPNVPGNYRKARFATSNLGISYLSAYIRQHHRDCQIDIIDGRFHGLTPAKAFEQIQAIDPQWIGMSLCVDEAAPWSQELATLIRAARRKIHITLGGYFPTLLTDQALEKFPMIDSIILGEGEETLSELIDRLVAKRDWRDIPGLAYREKCATISTPKRALIENLDLLPFPDRYLATGDGETIEVMMEGTRGCKFNCSFCAVQPFLRKNTGKSYRLRSADHIVAEINSLCSQYPKLQSFRFVDPDFIAPGTSERAERLVKILEESPRNIHFMMDTRISSIVPNQKLLQALNQVGLKRLYLGIESGSEHILKKMHKAIKVDEIVKGIQILQTIGIDYSYGFMMITPWSTDADIESNAHLLKTIGRIEFRSFFHEMTVIPGTYSYQQLSQNNQLVWCGSLSYYSYPSQSARIERFRKLNNQLQKRYPACFGGAAGFLYENNRQLRRTGQLEKAQELESLSDQLFLHVFEDCWEEAAKESVSMDLFTERCHEKFSPQFLSILHRIDPSMIFSTISERIPHHAPTIQI
ncbi:MAG: Radical domain protein [Parachlamydiales bacterium]|nr:Radical domain protein [Parachlamydiales bacterium]